MIYVYRYAMIYVYVFINAIFISKFGNCSFMLLHVWMFNDSKLLLTFISKILVAVLNHGMFKYVLCFLADETLGQGRNASR